MRDYRAIWNIEIIFTNFIPYFQLDLDTAEDESIKFDGQHPSPRSGDHTVGKNQASEGRFKQPHF